MGLNFYENLPFWHAFFTALGYEVIVSPAPSTRSLYLRGQATIPSDTVCYPAKLMHGHIDALLRMGADTIFYPACRTILTSSLATTISTARSSPIIPRGRRGQHPPAAGRALSSTTIWT